MYGNIKWDTHLYYPTVDSVEKALDSYDSEIPSIMKFAENQSQEVIIGEFTLSNLGIDQNLDNQGDWQDYANHIFERLSVNFGGALLWNFDC